MYFASLTISALLASIANAAVAPAGKPIQIQAIGNSRAPCMSTESSANQSLVLIEECITNPNIRAWTVVKGGASSGSGTPGQIKVHTNLCLDVTGGADKDGTQVQIYQCFDNNTNQKWQFNADGSIQWAGHNKCLDVTNGNYNSGTPLQIWTCSKGNKNQKWGASPVAPVPAAPKGKPIQFQNGLDPNAVFSSDGPCMQVEQPIDGTNATNGAPVEINFCHTTAAYRSWTVVNGGSNTGTGPTGPIQILDGFCLDVIDGKDADGTHLQMWKCAPGNKNQQWTVNSDFSIRWANHNKCIDLPGGIENGFSKLQIWTCGKNNRHQQWIPNPVDPVILD